MHIENQSSILREKRDLKDVFEHLHSVFPEEYIKIRLDLNTREYRGILKNGDCNAELVPKIAHGFGVKIENIFLGKVDPNAITARWFNEAYIPEKYQIGAFTSTAVTKNILNILKMIGGDALRKEVLQYMQTSNDYFESCDEHSKISTIFNSDIYYYLKRFKGFSDQDLFDIGLLTYDGYKNTDFASSFEGLSLIDIYTKFLEEISKHIEKSFDYHIIKIDGERAIVRKTFSEQMKDALHSNIYSNHEACMFSIGFASMLPMFKGLSPAKAIKTHCIFENKKFSEYIIDFSQSTQQQLYH